MKAPFTQVPNQLIRSEKLDCDEKLVLITILSCNPSFPSYAVISKWTGLSNDKIWKSLKKLESFKLIKRFKKGRGVQYFTHWTYPPDGKVEGQPIRYTERTYPPDGEEPIRQTVTKKTKEKEQKKREELSILESGNRERELSLAELNALMLEKCPF